MQSFSLERRSKIILGGLMIAILALMLVGLQQQFDQGDYRRALELIAARDPGATWSIGQELVERSKGSAPDCRPKLLSSFRGTLQVTCSTGEQTPYKFDVDLIRRTVCPADAAARSLVEAVEARNRPAPQPSGQGAAKPPGAKTQEMSTVER